MKSLIAGSAALLGVIAVPAQAQSLGTIINSVFASGYSDSYQPYNYGYQPTYSYGYQPSYGYQQSYSYGRPYRYSRSYAGYGYRSDGQSYGYSRDRSYEHRRHDRRRREENDDDQD